MKKVEKLSLNCHQTINLQHGTHQTVLMAGNKLCFYEEGREVVFELSSDYQFWELWEYGNDSLVTHGLCYLSQRDK